jgi:hypothetical protein
MNRITNESNRISFTMYILKLFFDHIGNFDDFKHLESRKYQIDELLEDKDFIKINENNVLNLSSNYYGFDYMFFPIKQNKQIEEKNSNDFTNLLNI